MDLGSGKPVGLPAGSLSYHHPLLSGFSSGRHPHPVTEDSASYGPGLFFQVASLDPATQGLSPTSELPLLRSSGLLHEDYRSLSLSPP